MYKVILVDDEEDVREGVVREVDWHAYGFDLIGQAENGREALEMVENAQPDIVVTDIRMPFMNGLQFAEVLRERFPMIKIIIITGHDEFEYAQKAIKLQIDEFVLKPFSSQELMQALLKMKGQIQAEEAHLENVQQLKEHYRNSIPVLKEKFLSTLISGGSRQSLNEVLDKAANYGIVLNGNRFVAAVISIDGVLISEDDSNRDELLRSVSLKYSEDSTLKYFSLLNITAEIVEKRGLGLVFMHQDQVVVLAVSDRNRDALVQETVRVLEEVRQSVTKYLKFSVTVGIGTAIKDVTKLSYSYEDAILALDYRLILGNNRMICIEDVENREMEKVRFDDLRENALTRAIKVGTNQEIKETLDELFQGVEVGVSIKDYQIYLLEILTCILKAAKDLNLNIDGVLGEDFIPFTKINNFTAMDEAKLWLMEICVSLKNHIATNRQSTYRILVERAKEYTKNHYHLGDISINKVCNHLHISTGYFSSIFKKETQMTFVNYLNHIRMEAGKVLLRTTDLRALEIAERIGYSDANYFSFSFRKKVGVTPKEYRNSFREARVELEV